MRLHTIVFILVLSAAAAAEIPTLHCPADPPRVRRLELQERWRIDTEDPETPLMGYFGQTQVVVHDGRVYMLDRQLCHVLVYSDDGEYLDTIMREGEGPGEIRRPGVMLLRDDGSLAVQHGYPTRLELVELDGTPRGRWRVACNTWLGRIQETSRGWFAAYLESKQSDEPGVFKSIYHVAYHDEEGRRTGTFHSEPQKHKHGSDRRSEIDEHNPWHTAVAVGDGEIVFAPVRDEYRLEWRNLQGETLRVVTRPFSAHRRTEDELAQIKYESYTIVRGDIQFPDRKLCAHDPVIRTLEPLPEGSLRVRTSLFAKDLPAGMVCRYELHGHEGELRERVEIYDPTGEYDTDYDMIALLDDGRAMVLRNLVPAFRVAYEPNLHPEQLAKLPPVPDDREDVAFAPVMCDLVPYAGGSGVPDRE